MPFFPHRLRQFRNALGRNEEDMGILIGLDTPTYQFLERGTQTMHSLQQEDFIRRFGKEVFDYIHGDRDHVEYHGQLLTREKALGDAFEVPESGLNVNANFKELDSLFHRYRDGSDKERDLMYKKMVLAYKSLEAENQKLRAENVQLKQALEEAKDMIAKRFLQKG